MIIVSWDAFVNQIFKNIFTCFSTSFSMGDRVGDRGRSDGLHGGKTDLVFFDFLHKSNEGIVVFMGGNSCCMCILYFSEVVEFGRRILLTCL